MRVFSWGSFMIRLSAEWRLFLKRSARASLEQVQFQVLVANTRFRTEHENGKVPVTRVASMGKLFSCSSGAIFSALGAKFRSRSDPRSSANPLAELSALIADRDIPVIAHFHSDVVRPIRNLLQLYGPFLDAFYRRANCIVVPTPRHIEISRFVSKYREEVSRRTLWHSRIPL